MKSMSYAVAMEFLKENPNFHLYAKVPFQDKLEKLSVYGEVDPDGISLPYLIKSDEEFLASTCIQTIPEGEIFSVEGEKHTEPSLTV